MKKPNKNKQRNESTFCLLWYLKAFYSFELGTPLFKDYFITKSRSINRNVTDGLNL